MANPTYIVFDTADAQGYHEEVRIRIKDGSFDGTVIPLASKIVAVRASLFGSDKVSDQIVYGYRVEVHNDPTDGLTGSDGNVATATYARFRNEIATSDWPFSLPGLNKSNVVFDPTNPNSFSVSGTIFDEMRTALTDAAIAWGDPSGAYSAASSANSLQLATAVQGKRAPKRVR